MAWTLDQYADYLDTRDIPWPAPPSIEPVKARPSVTRLREVKAVLWNVYGTLLAIPPDGELLFEHPNDLVMSAAIRKTIDEFKMWGSMTRKPGPPEKYMLHIYNELLTEQRMAPGGGEKFPEIHAEKIWEDVVKRKLKNDYKFDSLQLGSLNEYSKKIAYFLHSSMQSTCCYPTADRSLAHVAAVGKVQGLLANGQCFTAVQLRRGLRAINDSVRFDLVVPERFRFLSVDFHARKPSQRLFRHALEALEERGIRPAEVLHVGSRIDRDIAPAKKLGMRTALFAGDKTSIAATPEQLKDPATRPDLLLTELAQIEEAVG